jgi:DNA-binding Xre family transcriptional regulator
MSKKQDIPTSKQLFDEFGLHSANISVMKKKDKGLSRLKIYRDAWLFRTIISFMPAFFQKRFEVVIPTVSQLFEEFGTTPQNFSQLKSKQTKMYEIYVDAWNLHHVVFKRIVECED